MAIPRMVPLAVLAAAAGVLFCAACGKERPQSDGTESLIVLTLRVPGASKDETASFGETLLKAFESEDVGDIIAVEEGATFLEVTLRVRELSAINRIKKKIIEIEPATEYRIEHL